MFWPDDTSLADRTWWAEAAWQDGPSFGALLAAVRPAIRAALLLGYETDAVAVGFGRGIALPGEWQMIARKTLELLPGPSLSVEKQAEGPTLWLEVTPIHEMSEALGDILAEVDDQESSDSELRPIDDIAGTYAIAFDFGLLDSDDYTDDGTVPTGIVSAVADLVERAVQALAPRIPTRSQWINADRRLAREVNGGLAWVLDPGHWDGVGVGAEEGEPSVAASELVAVMEELTEEREAFLRGQLFAAREHHRPSSGPGPANLLFLLGVERFWPLRKHARFWTALLDELQARGEAHRLWERDRTRFTAEDAPTWLDVLGELLGRGVVRIFGLFEPGEPPTPLSVTAPTGDADEQVRLTVWGSTSLTLRRETVFADQPNEGVSGSAVWNYAPGAAGVPPTVILVAGRGVAIDHEVGALEGHPWTVQIFRVQDDMLVPRSGAQIDPMALLAPIEIEPQPIECVTDPADVVNVETLLFPQLLAKPKPDGVTLVYPVSQGTISNDMTSPFEHDPVVPSVIDLTVEPTSGTAAYAIDVRYFTDWNLDLPDLPGFSGVHVTVWATGGVRILSYESGNDTPQAGNPSGVTRDVNGHLFVAEFWQLQSWVSGEPPVSTVSAAARASAQRVGSHPLPRPWSVELPLTRWEDLFPSGTSLEWILLTLQNMWEGLVLQSIQDLFPPDRGHPFADADVPRLNYDRNARQAAWEDPVTGARFVLVPAAHQHDDFGAMDSLFFDLVDVGVGFIPFVGDAADIGELVYAWQTGRDRWGRPVTDFQLGLMVAGTALPFVSSVFLRGAAEFLGRLAEAVPDAARFRLFTQASWSDEIAVESAEAAMSQNSVVHRATLASSSKSGREATEDLIVKLADDTSLPADAADAALLARRLIDDTQDGWYTVDDLISDDGTGFALNSLQTGYTRFLRDNPGMTPREWMGVFDGG